METCKTCKHWAKVVRQSGMFVDSQTDEYRESLERYLSGGHCKHPKLEFAGNDCDTLTFQPYPMDESPLWTGPDFGCIHHEPLGVADDGK